MENFKKIFKRRGFAGNTPGHQEIAQDAPGMRTDRPLDQKVSNSHRKFSETQVRVSDPSLAKTDEPANRKSKTYTEYHPSSGTSSQRASVTALQDEINVALRDEEAVTTNPNSSPGRITKDDFQVLSLLGKGSFAKVVLCRSKLDGQIYAMKVVLKSALVQNRRVRDVFTEKRILQRSMHPFLIRLHSTFQSDSKLFFVMDYLPGGDLDTYLLRCQLKRFEYETARFYAAEVLLALQYLHENQCIYRDLKPENILLTSDGHIALADFGLSKDFYRNEAEGNETSVSTLSPPEMRTDSFVGSPFYVAPEVLLRREYDLRVDYWSYGILLFRMLCGRAPFLGRSMKEVFDAIVAQELRFTSSTVLPVEAKDLISRLLAKDATHRIHGQAVREHPFFNGIDFSHVYDKTFRNPVPQWIEQSRETSSGILPNGDAQPTSTGPYNESSRPVPHIAPHPHGTAHREHMQHQKKPAHCPGEGPIVPPSGLPCEEFINPNGVCEIVNTPVTQFALPHSQQQLFEGFSYCEDNTILMKESSERLK